MEIGVTRVDDNILCAGEKHEVARGHVGSDNFYRLADGREYVGHSQRTADSIAVGRNMCGNHDVIASFEQLTQLLDIFFVH